MSEATTLAASPTVEKKCRIGEVFDASLLELIRLVPRNPRVRALILKLTGKLPPADCDTFEQIKEWVEFNCKPRALARRTGVSPAGGISLPVQFSETEYGRANYSVRVQGSGEFQLETEDLMEMVEEAVDSGERLDDLVERIAQKVEEDAWSQCEPQMDDYGDYEYSDHDLNGNDDSETSCAKSDIRRAVLAFLQEGHADLLEQLQ